MVRDAGASSMRLSKSLILQASHDWHGCCNPSNERYRDQGVSGVRNICPVAAIKIAGRWRIRSWLDSGDTAWMIMATALVLLMTIPGLSLFYAGMVRVKNALSVLMQCFAITALVSVLWIIYGYSLAFDTTGMDAEELNLHSFVGGLGKAFMTGVTEDSLIVDDSGVGVRDLPADVRDHHSGADHRRLCRTDEVLGLARVHGALVHIRLPADDPHGLERCRRADVGLGSARLRRRYGRAYQCGHRRTRRGPRAGPAPRLSRVPRCRRTT